MHEPVPGYASALGTATDDLFARLRPDRPLWRLNWSLLDVLARLAAALRRMPDDMGRYKSLPVMAESTLAWLAAQLAARRS